MYQSGFSYTLTKPYPYPWFTWVVVIGGIAVTAVFSVFSVAANGYDPLLVTVSNPNETENPSSPAWFQKRPWSFASKTSSVCQDQVFPVYSTVFTTQLSLRHELQAIYKKNGDNWPNQRSLAYHHSPLQDCSTARITVAAWPGGYNVSFLSACVVYDNHAITPIEFWTYLDDLAVNQVTSDPKQWPSWFSWQSNLAITQLLAGVKQLAALTNSTSWKVRGDYFFTNTVDPISYQTVLSSSSVTYDNTTVTSRIGYLWLLDHDPREWPRQNDLAGQSNISVQAWTKTFGLKALSLFDTFAENTSPYLQPWNLSTPSVSLGLRIDNIAKLMYSSLMSDLGQSSSTNIFANPQDVWDYVNALEIMNDELGDNTFMNTLGNRMMPGDYSHQTYDFNDTTRQNISTLFAWGNTSTPTVSTSFLNTLYLCQVQKMKPVFSLVFAVIVADLVFLQAVWIGFNFVVKMILERRDDSANYCSGCANMIQTKGFASEVSPLSSTLRVDNISQEKPTMAMSITETTEITENTSSRRRQPAGAVPQNSVHPVEESTTLLSDAQIHSD